MVGVLLQTGLGKWVRFVIFISDSIIRHNGHADEVMEEYLQLSYRMPDIIRDLYGCSEQCAHEIFGDALRYIRKKESKYGTELDRKE